MGSDYVMQYALYFLQKLVKYPLFKHCTYSKLKYYFFLSKGFVPDNNNNHLY